MPQINLRVLLERARPVLEWLWQVLAVLMISLCLIWMGSRLPSDEPSPVVLEQVQHYVCIADADGVIRQCQLSISAKPRP